VVEVNADPKGHVPPQVTDGVVRVVSFINGTCAERWRIVSPLSGGTSGAFELIQTDGRRAVLKTRPGRFAWWIERGLITVDRLRRAGYPTPAYLEIGETDDGWTYWLMEHVVGRRMRLDSEGDLDLLFDLVDRQAGLDPPTDQDWSSYIHAVVFDNGNGWAEQMRNASTAAAELLVALEQAIAPCNDVHFSSHDAVIGDFGPHNILVHAGEVAGVVDTEASGRGTRIYDLWSLLSGDMPSPWRERVVNKVLSLTDQRGVAVLHAHDIIRPFDWTVASPEPAHIEASVAKGWLRLEELRDCLT
jgi:hypothetical protein